MSDQDTLKEIQQSVTDRKDEAFGKNLDLLFSTVYHEFIESFPLWFTNDNRKFIHPSVEEVWEGEDNKAIRHTTCVEFKMGENKYRINEEFRMGQGEDDFHNYELLMNNEPVFALSESYRVEGDTTSYTTISINAFVNEDWVEDFEAIKTHYFKILHGTKLTTESGTVNIQEIKQQFSIDETPNNEPVLNKDNNKINVPKLYGQLWVGMLVAIIIAVLVIVLM